MLTIGMSDLRLKLDVLVNCAINIFFIDACVSIEINLDSVLYNEDDFASARYSRD